jgi:integrase
MDTTEALAKYREHQDMRGLSSATIRQAGRELAQLADFIAPVELLDATHDDLMVWAGSLVGTRAVNSRYVKISRVHSFYKWAYDEDLIPSITTRRIPRPRILPGLPRPTPADAVIRAIACGNPTQRLWVKLAAFAGLRCCEIAMLSREQILDTADPPHLVVRGKGGKERVIYLCDDLLQELQSYEMPSRGWVFKRFDGQPGHPTASSVSQVGNRFLHNKAHVRESMHQLRHRFGTDVQRATGDIQVTAQLLGHSNIQTSRGYAQFSNARAMSAIKSLGRQNSTQPPTAA